MGMKTHIFKGVSVGEAVPLQTDDPFLFVYQTQGATLKIADAFERESFNVREKWSCRVGDNGGRYYVSHDGAAPVDIIIYSGDAESVITAAEFSGVVSGTVAVQQAVTITELPQFATGVVAANFLAASSSRTFFHVKNTHATAIMVIGGNGVTMAGAHELLPGEEWRETDGAQGAWYVISNTAGALLSITIGVY